MKVDPHYVRIAKDIASKIIKGVYPQNKSIKGRTILSGEYGVSSETIRKAIHLLANEGIVFVKPGVGIFIESIPNAIRFLEKFKDDEEHKKRIEELYSLIEQREALNDEIDGRIRDLTKGINLAGHQIETKEIVINEDSWVINQTIGDVYFYNYTEATIIAIKRNDRMIVSPGPDFTFIAGDKLIIVEKDELSYQRAITYLTYGAE